MIDLTPIENAIHNWVRLSSGFAADHVIWNEHADRIPDGPYIALEFGETDSIGDDWDEFVETVPGTVERILTGDRTMVLTIDCFVANGKWATVRPTARLEAIITAKNQDQYADPLSAAGVGFGPVGKIIPFNGKRSDVLEPRATVTLIVNLISRVTEPASVIENVEVEADIKPAPDDPVFPDVTFTVTNE